MLIKYFCRKIYNLFFYIILFDFFVNLSNFFPNLHFFNKVRGWILRPFFKKVGRNFAIASGNKIVMSRNMVIGDDVYIAHDCWINATGGLLLESGVIISPKNVIATTKHVYEGGRVYLDRSENARIIIKEGSWVCSSCVITKGVVIGRGNVICSGSVVVKDTEDYALCGGQPAVKIKSLI